MNDGLGKHSDQAIVIGAGMGGLLAARALSTHFDRVVLIERDQLEQGDAPRKGVPQGRHGHALLARGASELERLFPGLLDEIVARGGFSADGLEGLLWHQGGGYHARTTLGTRGASCSRGFLEGLVRDRIRSLGNVSLIDGTSVDDLIWSADNARVVGLIAHDRAGISHTLPAGLVLDASGRGSRLPTWLAEALYERPEESVVPVDIRYATRLFHRQPRETEGTVVFAATPEHKKPRGGFMFAVENDCWMVTLTGRRGEQPPLDLPGFRAYARSLGVDAIAEIAATSDPLDDGTAYSFRQSWYRRYDRLSRFPQGIIPFADSICSFNPIYGQGMTVAAIEANTLAAALDAGPHDLAQQFLEAITPSIESAWMLATGNDRRFVPDAASASRQVRFMHWYLDRLHVAARRDATVANAFGNVLHMIKPPQSLMKPAVSVRVLLHGREIGSRASRRNAPSSPAAASDKIDVAIS